MCYKNLYVVLELTNFFDILVAGASVHKLSGPFALLCCEKYIDEVSNAGY